MSSRSSKSAALSKFRQARRKRELGENDDDLFESNMKEDDDVYDIVDESEYQALVESRRQREDFVVDDDGLGYYDDGEELLGDEAGYKNDNESKKRRATTAALTAASLKKARKAKAAMQAAEAGEDEDEVIATNRSMWDFVQRGVNVQASRNTQTTTRGKTSSRSVDSLLEELDHVAATSRRARSRNSRIMSSRKTMSSSRRLNPRSSFSARREQDYSNDEDENNNHNNENDAIMEEQYQEPHDQGAGFIDTVDEPMEDENENDDAKKKSVAATEPEAVQEAKENGDKDDKAAFSTQQVVMEDTTETVQDGADKETPIKAGEEQSEQVSSKRRLARPKLGRRSAPAQRASEEAQQKELEETKQTKVETTVDTTSACFQPEHIQAEEKHSSSALSSLEAYTEVNEETKESYLDMFWFDAIEKKSEIFLFGKVACKGQDDSFLSCCVVVKGNLRDLYVLPRKQPGSDDYYDMMDVHKEIGSMLKPEYIPNKEGASWGSKLVKRSYAFGDSEIPRDKTDYLKVKYDAKYAAPSEEICQKGGRYYQKILNAGAPILESFILKRKLMGPCWIRIREPKEKRGGPVSWCPLEVIVENPKNIVRLDLVQPTGTSPRPPPEFVTVTLKLKTVVNPTSNKQEIVSVSAVCHRRVLVDTASDETNRFMTQLSLIRPVHPPDSSNDHGTARFPRDLDAEIKSKMPSLQKMPNERALLNRLVTQIGQWDPDILVGHHAWGHDMQVILARCAEHKVKIWSKLGRQRRVELPSRAQFNSGKEWVVADVLSGRLLCDTYLSAKEHLHETMYSLTHLAKSQLKTSHHEIEPIDIPQYYQSSKTIVALALHTLNDAQLVQRLMFKLQILPLTKQLTGIAGNLWSTTLKSNRANRTEYLLLHAFHKVKTLPPEKRRGKKKEETSGKAKYLGGLVLDPKVGLYDSFILLLDFNSLYPSIIQEYNLCFTTIDWSRYHKQGQEVGNEAAGGAPDLPPLPDSTLEQGILPQVIKQLVDNRRRVKALLKKESQPDKYEELNIRQKAFKLTANSMYGCLGFSHSRFFAQPIAAMVTSMGRQTLSRTVEIAQSTVGLEVIYGDTDSIMINTRITELESLKTVRALGEQVKKEVNKCYKTLELEIDGIFRSLLLLKKKKYAAVVIEQNPKTGEIRETREEKGLDLVRRDWCIQSKETGRFILDQVLSRQDKETVVNNVCTHLEQLATKMRNGNLALEKYVITKGLSKQPHEYPDAKGQPHVQVAKLMIKNSQRVGVGDHIPYIITAPLTSEGDEQSAKPSESYANRARHPDDITRSGGSLKPDVEWYLTQQILPPVSRLCEPIENIPRGLLAERLGLDSRKYNNGNSSTSIELNDDKLHFTPESCMPDEERFAGVNKLYLLCRSCGVKSEFPGIFSIMDRGADGKQQSGNLVGGLKCVNPNCTHPSLWGDATHLDCMSRIMNSMSALSKSEVNEYYKGIVRCNDPVCGLETRQLSVQGGSCLRRGCTGHMNQIYSERTLYTQIMYLLYLFDVNHACEQWERKNQYGTKKELMILINKADRQVWEELHKGAKAIVSTNDFCWITPTFWQSMFGTMQAKQ